MRITPDLTWAPSMNRAGAQYPAVSLGTRQVVSPASIDSNIEEAFAPTSPKKSWRWDAPGWPGNTIGSSVNGCEYPHRSTN